MPQQRGCTKLYSYLKEEVDARRNIQGGDKEVLERARHRMYLRRVK
jgi:hypothetical protein